MQTCQTTIITTAHCDVSTMQKYLKYTSVEEVTFPVIYVSFSLPSLPFQSLLLDEYIVFKDYLRLIMFNRWQSNNNSAVAEGQVTLFDSFKNVLCLE